MTKNVGVVGASGYGGAELLRLIAAHPGMQAAVVAAHTQQGERIDDLYPNLAGDRRFDAVDVDQLAGLDLVFLATPHDAAIELVSALADAQTPTVDLSGAFRLDAQGFSRWYGEEHPRPDLLPTAAASKDGEPGARAVYGLTEYARESVRSARLVANPGCYVITTLLSVLPLVGIIEDGSLVVDGKSGTSGAGRAPKDSLHFAHVDGSITAYGAPGHRHTGEIEHYLEVHGRHTGPVSFTPHLVPMPRGLLVTVYADLAEGADTDDVQSALVDAYRDEVFVHVLEPGRFPVTKAVLGSNGCQISAFVDDRTGRVVITGVTDNLGKGAASGAVQNANLMLGFDEGTGLTPVGVYP